MLFKVLLIGKIRDKLVAERIEEYRRRLGAYGKLEVVFLPDGTVESEGRAICRELDRDCPHQAFFSGRIGRNGAQKAHIPGIAVFLALLAEKVPLGEAEYVLYEAKAMEDLRRGRLIDGFVAEATGGEKWRCAVWEHRNDPTNMLVYLDLDGRTMLSFHDISLKDEALTQLNAFRMKAIRQGMQIFSIDRKAADEPSELARVSESIAEQVQ